MPHLTPFSGMIFLVIVAVGGVILALTATPMIRRNEGKWDTLFIGSLASSLFCLVVLTILLIGHKDFLPNVLN